MDLNKLYPNKIHYCTYNVTDDVLTEAENSLNDELDMYCLNIVFTQKFARIFFDLDDNQTIESKLYPDYFKDLVNKIQNHFPKDLKLQNYYVDLGGYTLASYVA